MTLSSDSSEIVLYSTVDGRVKFDTILYDKSIWLTQKKMAELFDVKRPAITKHLKNIFESGELNAGVVSSDLEHTTQHGAIEGKTQTRTVETGFWNMMLRSGMKKSRGMLQLGNSMRWQTKPGRNTNPERQKRFETFYHE